MLRETCNALAFRHWCFTETLAYSTSSPYRGAGYVLRRGFEFGMLSCFPLFWVPGVMGRVGEAIEGVGT